MPALASGNAGFPRKRNLFSSAPSPAKQRLNRLISCGKTFPIFYLCFFFFSFSGGGLEILNNPPPGSAECLRNHKSAEGHGYLSRPAGRPRECRETARSAAQRRLGNEAVCSGSPCGSIPTGGGVRRPQIRFDRGFWRFQRAAERRPFDAGGALPHCRDRKRMRS